MNVKFKHYFILLSLVLLIGCGPKIIITQEPSIVTNIQIEADENCDSTRD